jgi:catechol 2,3-dioxygenase-like lactoylglutathione lyase family enzyme
LTEITPILRIFDVAKAREFYLDFLGFTVAFEHRFDDAGPLYMRVTKGQVAIDLSEHFGDGAPGAWIRIATSGLAAYHADLLAKNYRHARPGLEREPWGETSMTIADPFYNHLVFFEPESAS